MPPIIDIPPQIKRHYSVTIVHKTYDTGQKYSFIVDCKHGSCVLKILKYSLGERENREISFYKQNENMAGIPKILDVRQFGSDWVVLEECIQGNNLGEIKQNYYGIQKIIIALAQRIIEVMSPFWYSGIVHRDLKPENIMISPNGSVSIIDFGIYKNPDNSTITATDFQPHTFFYAAPEQVIPNKADISYRTDFFSIGIIVFELLYQRHPFGAVKDEILAAYAAHKTIDFSSCYLNVFLDLCLQCDVSQRARSPQLLLNALA